MHTNNLARRIRRNRMCKCAVITLQLLKSATQHLPVACRHHSKNTTIPQASILAL